MDTVPYSAVISRLFEVLPDKQADFEERAKYLYGEGEPEIMYGSNLTQYMKCLANRLDDPDGEVAAELLLKVFDFLEVLASRGDFDTKCLVEVSVLESLLLDTKDYFPIMRRFMGPKTTELAFEVRRHRRDR